MNVHLSVVQSDTGGAGARGYLMLRVPVLHLSARHSRWRLLAILMLERTPLNLSDLLSHTLWLRHSEFVLLVDEQDDWPEEEEKLAMSTSREEGRIDALVTEFKTMISEEDTGLDGEEVMFSLVTWKESRKNISSTRFDRHYSSHSPASSAPNLERLRKNTSFSRDCSGPVGRFTQDWVGNRKVQEEGQESEYCSFLDAPGRAIIDTGCRRCVIGAATLEQHLIKLGKLADDVHWHDDPTQVTF